VIHDPSAVYGLLTYEGILEGQKYVGLFATEGFDPATSVPVFAMEASWDGAWDYVINTLDVGAIPDDEYYVAAFLDYSGDGLFNPGFDPCGVYGGASPIAVNLSNGRDAPNTSFVLADPVPAAHRRAVAWPIPAQSPRMRSFLDALVANEAAHRNR
jgi:hypothetical protein